MLYMFYEFYNFAEVQILRWLENYNCYMRKYGASVINLEAGETNAFQIAMVAGNKVECVDTYSKGECLEASSNVEYLDTNSKVERMDASSNVKYFDAGSRTECVNTNSKGECLDASSNG